MRFIERVHAGTETGEAVGAGAIGSRGEAHGRAEIIGPGQRDAGVGNSVFAWIAGACVVAVDINSTTQLRCTHLTEVVGRG